MTQSAGSFTWSKIDDFLAYWFQVNPLTGAERKTFDTYYAGYRRRFGSYIRHHYAQQSMEMVALLAGRQGQRLLEIGAGCGTEALWFACCGADVTAIDLSTERLAAAQARLDWLTQQPQYRSLEARFVNTSLFDFDPSEPFDLIWMEQTFHHVEPRERVYPKLQDLLKPGGTIVISEANAWNPMLQAQLFTRRGFQTKVRALDPQGRSIEYGNERITTPGALAHGLASAGFEIVTVRHFRMMPNVDMPDGWLDVERTLLRVLPWLSTHYNVVARRLG